MIMLTNVEDMSAPPENAWIVGWEESAKAVLTMSGGSFVGLPVKIDYISPRKVKREKWTIKKLAYELLPDQLFTVISAVANTASKALAAANAAKGDAAIAQSAAATAQSKANDASDTAFRSNKTGYVYANTNQETYFRVSEDEGAAKFEMVPKSADADVSLKIGDVFGVSACIRTDNNGKKVHFELPNHATGARLEGLVLSGIGTTSGCVLVENVMEVDMVSSTPGSTKKFKVTVDDTGTLSATEVTDTTT